MTDAPSSQGIPAWESFVLRHTKPGNLAVHFVSFLMFCGAPIAALLTWNPWWMIPFFASGLVGSLGHYLFNESNVSLNEATSDARVPFFVALIFYNIAKGTYAAEIAKARALCGASTETAGGPDGGLRE